MRVAIIGTAGRREEGQKLSLKLYNWMILHVLYELGKFGEEEEIHLQSGGAAWADHLAVSIYKIREGLSLNIQSLTIYGPTGWDINRYRDTGERDYEKNPGGTANYYHKLFSKKVGRNTLEGIADVLLQPGVTYYAGEGFKSRNLSVGKCDVLIALTFEEGNVPKDGGTRHTWDNSTAEMKIHISLMDYK